MDALTAEAQGSVRLWRLSYGLALRLALSGACGLCWGSRPSALSLVPLVFLAWWRSASRLEALVVVTSYHLVAVRSLVVGTARYFDVSAVLALAIVAFGALVAALPWACLWCGPSARVALGPRALRVFGILVLSTVPPLTAFAVPSVWTASGIWFPGAGFFGVAAMTLVGAVVGAPDDSDAKPFAAKSRVLALLALSGAVAFRHEVFDRDRDETQTPATSLADVRAVDTAFDGHRGDLMDFARQYDVTQTVLEAVRASDAPLVVLPESVAGLWLAITQRTWEPTAEVLRAQGRSVLLGVVFPIGADHRMNAGAVLLGADTGRYVQRVPLPFAMWTPGLSREGFTPEWLGASTLRVGAHAHAVFVCWEIGVLWSVFRAVLEGAESFVVLADTAWLRETSGEHVHRQALGAWSALFGVPGVIATNR